MHTRFPHPPRVAPRRTPEGALAPAGVCSWWRQATWLISALIAVLPAVAADKAPAPGPSTDPVMCDSQRPDDQQDPDCVEFGAAVGTLGLGWRQQLPARVRWLIRRDASDLCRQARSEFGERSTATLRDGCIFLSAQACTIVTLKPAAHAELGNAVRNCQP